MRALRDRLARRGDEGLTLAETVVSAAVGTMLLVFVTALSVAQIRGVDGASKRVAAASEVTGALDLMAKELRVAYSPGQDASGNPMPAFLAASGETVGFYANLRSLPATASPTQTFTPQEVWLWTRTSGTKRQLCHQVRPLTRDSTGKLNVPTPLTNVASRTCQVLVNDLAAADAVPTFTYLAGADTINAATGLSTSSLPTTGGAVADTTGIDAVQLRLRARAGTTRESATTTSVVRITLANTQ
ncbi:hypothetical protein [Kineococcus terrestris]|uniref:hypothetical protein n=1 Tax=Kineococcus terrestris TaxID=2044856 RepID=UPI0034DAF118